MKMKYFSTLLLSVALFAACSENENEKYTVILSLDSFRADYPDSCSTPNLDRMAKEGVYANVWTSYPNNTLSNNISVATGYYPWKHGIVADKFWDEKRGEYFDYNDPQKRNDATFYTGSPIWSRLEEQNIKTGVLYWAGCDIEIEGQKPTYYKSSFDSDKVLNSEERLETIVSWLKLPKEERPRFIMAQLEDENKTIETYGPESPEAYAYAEKTDEMVGKFLKKIKSLRNSKNINLIITSNQGMTEIKKNQTIDIYDYIDSKWINRIEGKNPLFVYAKEEFRDSIYERLCRVDNMYVFKNEDIPEDLRYRAKENISGNVMIAPGIGWQIKGYENETVKGMNGYFPVYQDMRVVFRAIGPDFKKGYDGLDFFNVDIYPFVENLYGLENKRVNGWYKRVEDLHISFKGEIVAPE